MDRELRVAEHDARHFEHVQDTFKVAALKRMMTAEMAKRYIVAPKKKHTELRGRVAAYVGVGEKMLKQNHALADIGEVEGEVGGGDDQIDVKHKEAAKR